MERKPCFHYFRFVPLFYPIITTRRRLIKYYETRSNLEEMDETKKTQGSEDRVEGWGVVGFECEQANF